MRNHYAARCVRTSVTTIDPVFTCPWIKIHRIHDRYSLSARSSRFLKSVVSTPSLRTVRRLTLSGVDPLFERSGVFSSFGEQSIATWKLPETFSPDTPTSHARRRFLYCLLNRKIENRSLMRFLAGTVRRIGRTRVSSAVGQG